MKTRGRNRGANNWTWTADCRAGDAPLFERERPQRGYRHLLKRRDVERFVALIPDWGELSAGLHWVVLSADTSCMGYQRRGEIAVCAWEAELWDEDSCRHWLREHDETLERLGVVVRKRGHRYVTEWTEDQARAFQLLHVFLHELGHHHDRWTTRSRRQCGDGEPYAESFALAFEELVWDDYVRVFPLLSTGPRQAVQAGRPGKEAAWILVTSSSAARSCARPSARPSTASTTAARTTATRWRSSSSHRSSCSA